MTEPGKDWIGGRVSLVDRIGREIDAQIIEARLGPGSFLGRESDLMARFGVSRPTLRKAVRQLEAANRVMTRTGVNGGLYVKDTSATAVMALARHIVMLGQPLSVFFALYMPFFAAVAVRAAERSSGADRERIAEIRDRMMSEPDTLEYFRQSRMALRSAILAATGNPALECFGIALVHAYIKILRGELQLGDTEQEKTRKIKEVEDALVSAILSGNVQATRRAYRETGRLEAAVTEETVRAGMLPARSIPQTLFAPVGDDQPPDKLAEHVARAIRREISLVEGSPGASLGSIPDIAARFGVSYDICREAMGLLAGHGVVTLHRGRGGGVHIGRPIMARFAHVLRRDLVEKANEGHIAELSAVLAEIRAELPVDDTDMKRTVEFLDEMLALLDTSTKRASGIRDIRRPPG